MLSIPDCYYLMHIVIEYRFYSYRFFLSPLNYIQYMHYIKIWLLLCVFNNRTVITWRDTEPGHYSAFSIIERLLLVRVSLMWFCSYTFRVILFQDFNLILIDVFLSHGIGERQWSTFVSSFLEWNQKPCITLHSQTPFARGIVGCHYDNIPCHYCLYFNTVIQNQLGRNDCCVVDCFPVPYDNWEQDGAHRLDTLGRVDSSWGASTLGRYDCGAHRPDTIPNVHGR